MAVLKRIVLMVFMALLVCISAFAAETRLIDSKGDDLAAYHLVSNSYKEADGTGVNGTATEKLSQVSAAKLLMTRVPTAIWQVSLQGLHDRITSSS